MLVGTDDLLYEKEELERQNSALVAQNDELAAAVREASVQRGSRPRRLRRPKLNATTFVSASRNFARNSTSCVLGLIRGPRHIRYRSQAREWNDQLEEEREELYGMLDEAKLHHNGTPYEAENWRQQAHEGTDWQPPQVHSDSHEAAEQLPAEAGPPADVDM